MSNNITVNWKVNTDEVTKSRDVLIQAQQAADKYTQAATKGGNESAKAFGKNQKSIDDMRIRLKELKTIMDTLPQTATKRLAQYSAEYKKLDAEVRKVTKDLYEQEKAAKAVGSATQNNTKLFGELGATIQAALTVAALKQAVSLTLEMARLSGNVEGVERAFKRAFPGSAFLLNELRNSVHGTVSDFELMQRTLQATNLGVSVEHLGVLFEFAATRAQQTGESVDYLVDSIVRGIGRKSLLVLDNLGLSATRLKEQFNGASLASQSVAEVTRGVAAIAKVELEKMGGFAETTATKVAQITAEYENLKKAVADRVTSNNLLDFYSRIIEATRIATLTEMQYRSELQRTEAQRFVAAFRERELTEEVTKDRQKAFDIIQQEMNTTLELIGRNNDRLKEISESVGKVSLSEALLNQKRKTYYEDQNLRYAATILLLKDILRLYAETVAKTEESLGLIAAKEAEIEGVNDALKAAKSTQEIHNLNVELEKLNGELADLKAFGTTKRFLEVNGKLKLVPVIAPKGAAETIKPEVIDFSKQLDDFIKKQLLGLGPYGLQIMVETNRKPPSKTPAAIRNIGPLAKPSEEIVPMDDWERIGQEFADNWKSILGQGLSDTTSFFDSVFQAEADSYDARIAQSRQYYDRLQILAGDNEKAKDRLRLREQKEENKLRREAFEADKRAKRSSAVINGAAGVINAFATLPYPAAIVAAALIAAETAAQIAVINRQQPRFAKGVIDLKGPGTKTSDSINAKLSKGESVMTADETGSARGILNDIRAGKLNDKKLARQLDSAVLRDLKITKDGIKMVGMDDSRIVKKLDQLMNAQPDYMEKSGVLWKTKQKSENYKKWVRAKIM